MIGNYTVYDKSMNGIKTLSDGISMIQNGVASHDNIIYTSYIKSDDEITTLTNDSLTTTNINCNTLNTSTINAGTETLTTLNCTNLYCDTNGLIVNGTSNIITANFPQVNNESFTIQSNVLNLYSSRINQTGAPSENILKDTQINGTLICQSDITQNGGSTTLKSVTCNDINMTANSSITQTGSTVGNSLGTTTISNLNVLSSISLPSDITISGANYTDDIDMTNGARITQDVTMAGTNFNTLFYTKLSKIDVLGNLTQSSGSTTLLNTTIQGTTQLQGDITQTSGVCGLKAINADQITLNTNKDLFFSSGTGKINQSLLMAGTNNLLSDITLNSNSILTQSGTGYITQSGTGANSLKNTNISGTFTVSGNTSLAGMTATTGTITTLNSTNATLTNISGTTLNVGNISNSEFNTLDGNTQNINTKFNSLDSQISSLSTTAGTSSVALTGISYTSGTDTTTIDNNLTISTGKALVVGSTNIINSINAINTALTGISYDSAQDLTTINNHVYISTGNNFYLGNLSYNVKTNLDDCINKLSGFTYTSGSDLTTIDNNVTINKTLIVNGMNITAELTALDTSFTTGTINTTDLTTTNLTVSNLNVTTQSDMKLTNINTSYGPTATASLSVRDTTSNKKLIVIPNISGGSYNGIANVNDISIVGVSSTSNDSVLNLTTWSNIKTGIKINSNSTSIFAGNNNSLLLNESSLTINGNTNLNNNIYNTGLNEYSATTPSYTYSKTLGQSAILLASISIPKSFNSIITLSSPLSVYRSGSSSPSGAVFILHQETISAITGYVTKNGTFLNNLTITTNNTLPQTKKFQHLSVSFNYEQYVTNLTTSFTPSFDIDNVNVYNIYITVTSSYSVNFADMPGTTSGYYINTNEVSHNGSANIIFGSPDGTNYSATNFSTSFFDANYMSSNNSQVQINNMLSNNISNQSTIKTNTLNASSTINTSTINTSILNSSTINSTDLTLTGLLKSNRIACKYGQIGAFAIRLNQAPIAIFSSFGNSGAMLGLSNNDDGYIVNPGYKIIPYYDVAYSGAYTQTMDNTNGTQPKYYINNSSDINSVSSIKLFWYGEEVNYAL